MRRSHPAKLLQIHIVESDRFQGAPLYEAIVARCRQMKIAGATVFRGLEGYGETAGLHKAHLIRRDQPIVISIVDTEENLAPLLPVVEQMIDTGLLVLTPVQIIRVQKEKTSGSAPDSGVPPG